MGFLSISSLVSKKFLPGEKRTWKIFLLDITKQLFTAGFGHALNLLFAEVLLQATSSGNGCVWYLMNVVFDMCAGTFISYVLFKLVDYIATTNGIEVLKSGVYIDEKVDLTEQN